MPAVVQPIEMVDSYVSTQTLLMLKKNWCTVWARDRNNLLGIQCFCHWSIFISVIVSAIL